MKRRDLLGLATLPGLVSRLRAADPKYKISLAQWSLHRAIQSRLLTNLDFPRVARDQFGIEGLEFVNTLWMSPTQDYVTQLKRRMNDSGTKCVLIMCDGEGLMGNADRALRMRAAANHHKWVDITAELGGHSIRTNMYPSKAPTNEAEIAEFLKYCAESFTALAGYAAKANINVTIENHGGVSSNPDVVIRLMKMVNLPNFGTLPDFGNFPKEIDRYDAVTKLMAYAKAVSFKCMDFKDGKESTMDMDRLMKIVGDAGYKSWIGIEYEGTRLSEYEGIGAAAAWLRARI